MPTTPNQTTFATRKAKAKLARRIARLVKAANLTYEEWRSLNKRVRKLAGLTVPRTGRKLPRILTDDAFARFFAVVDQATNPLHAIMLRLLFQTGARVSELCGIQVADVDLTNCRIRINDGKGGKDRFVLFGQTFALTLKTYLSAHPANVYLFQSRQGGAFTSRRIQQIVKDYATKAGVEATPHTFRHQAITYLTRAGLQDRELQLITGHSRRDTLAVYQHIALSEHLEAKYQDAMKDAGI